MTVAVCVGGFPLFLIDRDQQRLASRVVSGLSRDTLQNSRRCPRFNDLRQEVREAMREVDEACRAFKCVSEISYRRKLLLR